VEPLELVVLRVLVLVGETERWERPKSVERREGVSASFSGTGGAVSSECRPNRGMLLIFSRTRLREMEVLVSWYFLVLDGKSGMRMLRRELEEELWSEDVYMYLGVWCS
jgi:hypothetical protein